MNKYGKYVHCSPFARVTHDVDVGDAALAAVKAGDQSYSPRSIGSAIWSLKSTAQSLANWVDIDSVPSCWIVEVANAVAHKQALKRYSVGLSLDRRYTCRWQDHRDKFLALRISPMQTVDSHNGRQ